MKTFGNISLILPGVLLFLVLGEAESPQSKNSKTGTTL